MADSDELALKLGRKLLASARKHSATKTLQRDDFAVTRVKLRLPITRFDGLTLATGTGAATGDPVTINADPTDTSIADSD